MNAVSVTNDAKYHHCLAMADDLIDFSDKAEKYTKVRTRPAEITDFPQTLVAEKIIFVIDILLLANESKNEVNIRYILNLCKNYFNVKKKICVKPVKFECLIYNSNAVLHSHIDIVKDLHAALLKISTLECDEETQPLKIDKVFHEIANLVELPDPESSIKGLPPNWVYHVVWLFGRNLHVPIMESTNSFDYLMMTPYFALDILYLYDKSLECNKCELISQALLNLNENEQGYFLSTSISQKTKLSSCFSQFLGHPLIRVPQVKAKFNVLEFDKQIGGDNELEDV